MKLPDQSIVCTFEIWFTHLPTCPQEALTSTTEYRVSFLSRVSRWVYLSVSGIWRYYYDIAEECVCDSKGKDLFSQVTKHISKCSQSFRANHSKGGHIRGQIIGIAAKVDTEISASPSLARPENFSSNVVGWVIWARRDGANSTNRNWCQKFPKPKAFRTWRLVLVMVLVEDRTVLGTQLTGKNPERI